MFTKRNLLILGAAVFTFLSWNRAEKKPGQVSTVQKAVAQVLRLRPATVRQSLSVKAAAPHRAAVVETELDQIPSPECRALWRNLSALDLNRFGNSLSGTLNTTETRGLVEDVVRAASENPCSTFSPSVSVQNSFNLLLASCQAAVKDGGDPVGRALSSAECGNTLILHRATTVEWLTGAIGLTEISDPGVLSNKLLALALQQEAAPPGKIIAVAERLLEVDPSNTDAARYALQARLLPGASTSKEDFQNALKRAENLGVDAPSLWRFKADHAAAVGDADALRTLVETAEEQGEASPLNPYYLAWAFFLEGKTDDARAALEAMQSSGDKFAPVLAKEALENLKQPALGAQAPVFSDPFLAFSLVSASE